MPEADDNGQLRDHLRVLRQRKWTVVLFALLAVAASVAVSRLQTRVYQASADILLEAQTTELTFGQEVTTLEPPTEIRLLESEPVRRIVQQRIGDVPGVSVTNPAQTEFLVVTAESPDPERAVLVADTYAQAYVDFRRQQAVDAIEARIGKLEAKVEELDRGIAAEATQGDPTTMSLQENRDLFATRVDQLNVAVTEATGGAQLVSPSEVPTVPVRPTPVRNAAVALFVGLVLGVGLAFLREHLDDSLKTKDDVERLVPGVPVLGLVPALPGWKDKKAALVVSATDPKSPVAEAYRSLRTSVQFVGLERSLRTLQVTSPSTAEGKSTTVANLAVAVAGSGRRVVVVDADLRRPRLHSFFGLPQHAGLTSVLIGESSLDDALQEVPGVPRLSLLAAGPIPPNPSELLAGEHCADQFRELVRRFDLVLIDCPPVLPVTDASVLASRVDGTLLVVSSSETERRPLRRAVEILGHVNAPLLGLVLNCVTDEDSYGYGYTYRYASPPDHRKPRGEEAASEPQPAVAVKANRGAARSWAVPPRRPSTMQRVQDPERR